MAYTIKDQTRYALEGSIFMAVTALKWLGDGLNIIDNHFEPKMNATKREKLLKGWTSLLRSTLGFTP